MVPFVVFIRCHLTADFFKGAAIGMGFFEQLAEPIIAAFHLAHDVSRAGKATFLVEEDDVVDVMHIHDEAPHLLGDFLLGVVHVEKDFAEAFADDAKVCGHLLEVVVIIVVSASTKSFGLGFEVFGQESLLG